MKVLIVEDETVAAQQLQRFIQSYDRSFEVVGFIKSCSGLQKWAQEKREADLVFCDIELSDGNVLPTLQSLDLMAAFVFTTAYDNFWSQALRLNGLDYLLKPLTFEKVHAAIKKIETLQKVFSNAPSQIVNLAALMQKNEMSAYKKRFAVRLNNEVFVVEAAAVHFFRIQEGIIFAYTGNAKKYPLIEETLNDLEEKLHPEFFFRINRSEIINLQFFNYLRIHKANEYVISLKDIDEPLSVSNSRIPQLKEWLDNPVSNYRKSP